MRRRALKKYWKRLGELTRLKNARRATNCCSKSARPRRRPARRRGLVDAVTCHRRACSRISSIATSCASSRRREGRYLLRTNLTADDPERSGAAICNWCLWRRRSARSKATWRCGRCIIKSRTAIEAHLFIAFLAYCLAITLRQQLRGLAGGLMPRVVFEKFATVQMLDVRVPTTDGPRTTVIAPD